MYYSVGDCRTIGRKGCEGVQLGYLVNPIITSWIDSRFLPVTMIQDSTIACHPRTMIVFSRIKALLGLILAIAVATQAVRPRRISELFGSPWNQCCAFIRIRKAGEVVI